MYNQFRQKSFIFGKNQLMLFAETDHT
jgi:hypothetical protein